MVTPTDPHLISGFQALTTGAGLVDFSEQTLVELTGDDRAKFLHSFCTNEIIKLAAGNGCEAFLLNAQGKILAYVLVLADRDAIVLETVGGQGPAIVKHLDRYLIRERVKIVDRSSDWTEWLLAGPKSADVLEKLCPGAVPKLAWTGGEATIAGHPVRLWRIDIVGPTGFLIIGQRSSAAAIGEAIIAAGAAPVAAAAFAAVRIEAGFPIFGVDVTEKNLPQEVARDRRTISFTKGCYLGQETVARIDALGHVNRLLVGLRISGSDVPPPGTALSAGGVEVGQITSAAFSPGTGGIVALAFVRRGQHAPGTQLDWTGGTAQVVSLPASQL